MASGNGTSFGAFIRTRREERGWTQAELHRRICGKSSKSNQIRTSEIERGVRLPLPRYLPVFAKVLKVDLAAMKKLYLRDWHARITKRVDAEIAHAQRRSHKKMSTSPRKRS